MGLLHRSSVRGYSFGPPCPVAPAKIANPSSSSAAGSCLIHTGRQPLVEQPGHAPEQSDIAIRLLKKVTRKLIQ